MLTAYVQNSKDYMIKSLRRHPLFCVRVLRHPLFCVRILRHPLFCVRVLRHPLFCVRVPRNPLFCVHVLRFYCVSTFAHTHHAYREDAEVDGPLDVTITLLNE